uniref:Uncharacterized protein n=1 Tax=Fagus sylvatica TaxID=28930 RepID=A0A2N9HSE4_FAGSY
MQPLCHDDERLALLQFKESFIINKLASLGDPFAYPKVKSWTSKGESSDCCSWDGVECDETQVGNLSRLTYLNLSHSVLSGEIPFEVSKLFQLSTLDICCNDDFSSEKFSLQLKEMSLTSLVGNLTRIENLDVSGVSIISTVPNILANMTTLRSLYLHDCGMYGEFPIGIFKLPNLRVLDVKYNADLTTYWPDFQYWSSPLEELDLGATNFSGELPASMGNLKSLIALNMWGCNLSGSIPSSIGNLTNLIYLRLSNNSLAGNIPPSIGNLIQLGFLDLSSNQLNGPIPFEFANLTQLIVLSLGSNRLTGLIPFGLANLTQLHTFSLLGNERGQPFSIWNLNILDNNYHKCHDPNPNQGFRYMT